MVKAIGASSCGLLMLGVGDLSESLQGAASVVIPAYNAESTLKETVWSALNQTVPPREVLIIDDGSTDRTWTLIRDLMQQSPNVFGIHLETNSGLPGVVRNIGIAESSGRFVSFLDSDDTWTNRHLEIHLTAMNDHPSTSMVYSHLWTIRKNIPGWGLVFLPGGQQCDTSFDQLSRRNSIQCSAVTLRREVLETVGIFSERAELRAVEDYDLWLRISRSHEIRYIPRVTGIYNDRGGISASEDMEQRLQNLARVHGITISRRSKAGRLWERARTLPSALSLHFTQLR